MSAKFEVLVGPSMSGKTYQLSKQVLTEAFENPDKNYIVVVPEQSGNAYERSLIKMNKALFQRPGFFNIDVVGFNRLAFRVFEEVGIKESQVFEEYEKNMLVRVILGRIGKQLKVYENSIDKIGFISEMKNLISELISYGITPEELGGLMDVFSKDDNPSLANKLSDIKSIYTEYLDHFDDVFMNISEGRLKLFSRILKSDKKINITDGAVFVFDEYRGYTPDQLEVIEELSKRAEVLRFSLCMEKNTLSNPGDVKKHDLFSKSLDTLKDIQKAVGLSPELLYTDGSAIPENPDTLKHLRDSIFRYPVKEYTGDMDDCLKVFSVVSREDEMRVVAELIRDEIKCGYRYEDIVIVTGDTEGFDRHAAGIFRDYDIPIFCDYNRQLRKNPYTEALIRILDIVDKEYDYDSVFGFMKTGVWKVDNRQAMNSLENLILKTGIRGHKLWSRELKAKNQAEEMNRIRADFMELMEPLYKVSKGKNKVSEYIAALRTIIDKLDYQNSISEDIEFLEKEGLYSDALVMKGLYEVISDCLIKTENLLGDEMMTIHDFSELLSSGISDITIGIIPPTIDCVCVSDISRSRITGAKIIHFISMNDGIIPAPSKAGRIISDRERRSITEKLEELGTGKKLADSDLDKRIEDLFIIYQVLSKPTDRLTISYFGVDEEGNKAQPSYVVGRILRLYPTLFSEQLEPRCFKGTSTSDRPEYIKWLREAVDKLHKKEADDIYKEDLKKIARYACFMDGEEPWDDNIFAGLNFSNAAGPVPEKTLENINMNLSVSKIEKYSSCPYSFFLRYVLGLKERPDRKVELYDIGSIVHEALEKTVGEVKSDFDNNWKDISNDRLKSVMGKYLEDSWRNYEEETRLGDDESGKLSMIYRNLQDLSDRTIITLKEHIVAGKLLPERVEQGFSATINLKRSDGRIMPVVINGMIDRIDSYEDDSGYYIRIIDYKTGNKDFSIQEIKEGSSVQLSLYTKIITEVLMDKMKDKKVIPSGMYYYHVDNPVINKVSDNSYNWEEVKIEETAQKEIRKMQTLRGITNADPEALVGLHDMSVIRDEDGKVIKDSIVVPVTVSKKEGTIKSGSPVTDAAGFKDICDFSTIVLEDTADRIYSGEYKKEPKVYKGRKSPCDYCEYKAVCRFNDAAGKEKTVYKDKSNIQSQIDELMTLMKEREKPEITSARFFNSEEH